VCVLYVLCVLVCVLVYVHLRLHVLSWRIQRDRKIW